MRYDAVTFLESLFREPGGAPPAGDGTAHALRSHSLPTPNADIRVEDLDPEWRVEWEERAAIMEYGGNLPRERAEAEALKDSLEQMRQTERGSG